MIKKIKFLIFIFFFLIVLFFGFLKKDKKQNYFVNKIQNNNFINLNFLKKIDNFKKYKEIKVKTDLLDFVINTDNGNIENIKLLKYKEDLKSNKKIELLKKTNTFIYEIKNGIIKKDFNNNKIVNLKFKTEKSFYTINKEKYLLIPMYFKDKNNNIYIKTFILNNNNYEIKIINTFLNNNSIPIKLSYFGKIQQTIDLPENIKKNNKINNKSFRGAAYSSDLEKYKKIYFNNDKNININTKFGWITMIQKYFLTVLFPNNITNNIFYTEKKKNNIFIIGYQSKPIIIKPFKIKNINESLWIGPKLQNDIEKISPYLNFTTNYGILWFISKPLLKILIFLNSIVNNWGFSIILITLLLRFLLFPITQIQYKYIKKLSTLSIKIKNIYNNKNRKNSINKEILKLYKNEKINPLLGLTSFIQMPIFIALYNMLIESIELRHSKFIFWIDDLSSKDPYYVLPCLLSITIFFIQRISPKINNNKLQKKIMILISFFFSMFFFYLPSGLIIYYIVNNIFIIFQQKLIYKKKINKFK